MAKKPLPAPTSSSNVVEGMRISADHQRYITSLDEAVRGSIARLSVPLDAGVWPVAADIPAGDCQLWKNGSAIRLYANDGGTLRYVALT